MEYEEVREYVVSSVLTFDGLDAAALAAIEPAVKRGIAATLNVDESRGRSCVEPMRGGRRHLHLTHDLSGL